MRSPPSYVAHLTSLKSLRVKREKGEVLAAFVAHKKEVTAGYMPKLLMSRKSQQP